jgi:hypothetical protein
MYHNIMLHKRKRKYIKEKEKGSATNPDPSGIGGNMLCKLKAAYIISINLSALAPLKGDLPINHAKMKIN